jgi:hypothetical protein|nr:MAG TPA: hypothetical protein [Caudoviricetes sp.]
MSFKGKVKRLNKELIKLRDDLETERLSNRRLRQKLDKQYTEQLENIIKFAITNHKYVMINQWAVDNSHKWGIASFRYNEDEDY